MKGPSTSERLWGFAVGCATLGALAGLLLAFGACEGVSWGWIAGAVALSCCAWLAVLGVRSMMRSLREFARLVGSAVDDAAPSPLHSELEELQAVAVAVNRLHARGRALVAELEAERAHGTQTGLPQVGSTDKQRALAEANARAATLMAQMEEKNKQIENAMARLKEAQEGLISAERLAVLGQMAGIVAHEVLQPVTAISVRVELNLKRAPKAARALAKLKTALARLADHQEQGDLQSYLADGGDQDLVLLQRICSALIKGDQARLEDISFMDKQVAKVVRIVDGFRHLSKSRRSVEDVDAKSVVADVLEDLSDRMRKNGVELVQELRDVPVLRADQTEIYSMVANVARNAVQAMSENNDSPRRLSVRLAAEDRSICLQIEDTGIGIAPSNWESIFEVGFSSKGREGTGYGLSFSRKLARGYLGDIRVLRSELGKGTTMLIQLPLDQANQQAA